MNDGIQAISNRAGIRASTEHNFWFRPRLQALNICLENEYRAGTPIRRNLLTTSAAFFQDKVKLSKMSIS